MSEFYELGAQRPPLGAQKPFLGDDRTLIRATFILGAVLVIWKLYIALISHVIWEEGHFVMSGEYLALGYPDIPPGFPWLARIVTTIFGWHVLPLRLVSLAIATAIPFAIYFLATPITSHRNALWAAMIAILMPPLSMNGTVFYPEGSLQLCMALMLGCLIRAIQQDKLKWWLLTGLCAGLGLLVHFRFLAAGLAVVVYMLVNREGRRLWRRPGVWITAGVAVLGLLPSLVYNAMNHWPAIQFHILNRPKLQPDLGRILGYTENQLGLCTPVFFVAMVVAIKNLVTRDRDRPEAVLAWQAIVIFLVYGLQTIVNKKVMPHWPFMADVPLVALIPGLLESFVAKAKTVNGHRLRMAAVASGPILAVAVGLTGTAYQWGWQHSATLPYELRERNTLKNEDWSLLEPDLAAADARAKARFGPDIAWATNSHMSAVHLEFPALKTKDRRLFTLDDPNDELTRFVVARRQWGLDIDTLAKDHAGKGVMIAVLEPSYLYHEPDQVAMYTRLCETFDEVEPFKVTSLPPYKMAIDFYTARVRATPLPAMAAEPCPFFPQIYIAHPERGEFVGKHSREQFFGVAADPKGIKSLDILLDGKVAVAAKYGIDDPNYHVPPLLKYDPNWPRLQYTFTFPEGSLVPGEHVLTERATRSDGTTFESGPRTLYVRK